MVIKKTVIGIFIAAIYNLVGAGCHKCIRQDFSFAIDTSYFYPQLDSVPLGDTIYFLSKTSTTLTDLTSGQKVDYSNSPNFGGILGVTELIALNQTGDGVADFTFIPLVGQIYTDSTAPSPGKAKQIIYAEQSGEYNLALALVTRKKGIYAIFTGDLPDVVKNCFRAKVKMNLMNSEPHLLYLKNIYYGGGPLNSYDSTHSYCFKVY